MKNFKVIYYIGAVFLAGVVTLVYLSLGQTEKTLPKIKLSYFKSDAEVAESIHSILQQQIKKEKHFWFGVEPGFTNQLQIFEKLKAEIEKENGPFDVVYVDQELKLKNEERSLFGKPVPHDIKENWGHVADEIKKNADKKVLVISAAIYTTNFLKENPIHKIKEASGVTPMTFSAGYFAARPDEEKNNIFRCVTDDKEGVAAWGCLVLNKARSQRRKVDTKKIDPPSSLTAGVMDLTGEKDYMLLVR